MNPPTANACMCSLQTLSRQLSVLATAQRRTTVVEKLGLDERQAERFVQRATGSYSLLVDEQLRVLAPRNSNDAAIISQ